MDTIDIIDGQYEDSGQLQFVSALKAGFPSPAEDYANASLDFNRDLIRHPEATFYARISGDSMQEIGIEDGDLAVIDRSLQPADGDVVVAFVNNEFTIKKLSLQHKTDGYIELLPANANYAPIRIERPDEFQVWGVVAYTIKRWKR